MCKITLQRYKELPGIKIPHYQRVTADEVRPIIFSFDFSLFFTASRNCYLLNAALSDNFVLIFHLLLIINLNALKTKLVFYKDAF